MNDAEKLERAIALLRRLNACAWSDASEYDVIMEISAFIDELDRETVA